MLCVNTQELFQHNDKVYQACWRPHNKWSRALMASNPVDRILGSLPRPPSDRKVWILSEKQGSSLWMGERAYTSVHARFYYLWHTKKLHVTKCTFRSTDKDKSNPCLTKVDVALMIPRAKAFWCNLKINLCCCFPERLSFPQSTCSGCILIINDNQKD